MGRGGKRWRPFKEIPAKVEDWGGGWGGQDDENDQPQTHFSLREQARNTERRPPPHFSLRDEAQNAESRHQQRSSTPKIRRGPVPFVSVGQFTLDQSLKNAQANDDSPSHPGPHVATIPDNTPVPQGELMSRLTLQESPLRGDPGPAGTNTVVGTDIPSEVEQRNGLANDGLKKKDNYVTFFEDTRGTQKPTHTGYSQPVIRRSKSPEFSDSSDEVIVFTGRGRVGGEPRIGRRLSGDGSSSLQRSHGASGQGATIIDDAVNLDVVSTNFHVSNQNSPGPVSAKIGDSNHKTPKPKSRKRSKRKQPSRKQAHDEEIITDRITNIDKSDDSEHLEHNAMNLESHSCDGQGATIIDDHVNLDAPSTTFRTSKHNSARPVSEVIGDSNHNPQTPKPKSRKRSKGKQISRKQAHDDEIIADYIANIDESDDSEHLEHHAMNLERDIGILTDNTEGIQDISHTNKLEQDKFDGDNKNWEDIDDLSTSSEEIAKIGKVLSKRHRNSGTQYLVEEGSSDGVARWIPLSSLKTADAGHHIRIYESKLLEVEAGLTSSEDSADDRSEDEIAADLQEDLDDILDEKDLWDRRIERLTDEKIARLLSKQEELGLGSSELMLADGDGNDEDDEDENDDQCPSSRNGAYRNGRRNGRKQNQPTDSLLSSNPFADELDADHYGDFNIMDLNRPSLRRLPKGRSRISALAFEDKETENSMRVLWENDRAKKKIRKQEREELRAQGLLGKKSKPNTKVTDSHKMSIDEIKSEIRAFLLSSGPRLALPPLKQRERKFVHEIAHIHNLKSKSIGEEGSRFPVLAKTSHTTTFDENVVTALETRFGFRVRREKGIRPKGVPRVRKARGADLRVTYQDGEVVGGAAPELGQENKGRAMMEKMGWSKGTALGALHNKGIMLPIPHVVRNTKAGLG